MTDFSALWTEHRNYVFRLVLSSVRHASDADDLMQVIAIEAYKSFHTLRDPAKFRPWIRCIAVRVIKRYHKRFYTKPEELLDPAKLEKRLSGYQPNFAADADARLLVRDFIEALPGKWADALALYLYYDVSIRDINAMLGGKYTTTYANIRRLCRELETLCSAQEVTGHEE